MTEEDWLLSGDPTKMLAFAADTASERQWRLLACGCCRTFFWNALPNDECRVVIDVAEQFADGQATAGARQQAMMAATTALPRLTRESKYFLPRQLVVTMTYQGPTASELARHVVDQICVLGEQRLPQGERRCKTTKERLRLAGLIRDVFGNPLRTVTLDPTWQTRNVVAIAEAIYAERAFERLPILADALEEAGCTNEEVLQHCRQPGEHVRGCWVVDRVLGRE